MFTRRRNAVRRFEDLARDQPLIRRLGTPPSPTCLRSLAKGTRQRHREVFTAGKTGILETAQAWRNTRHVASKHRFTCRNRIIGSACAVTIPSDASAYSSSGIPIYQPGVDHGGVNRGGVYRGAHHRGGHYRGSWRGGRRRGCRRCRCRSILRTALRILSLRPVLLIGHCPSVGKRRARDRNPRRWPVICM